MMSPERVFFINKGVASKSLSRSGGAEKSRIFSHVQRPSQNGLLHSPTEPPSSSDSGDSGDAEGVTWERMTSSDKACSSAVARSKRSCSNTIQNRHSATHRPVVKVPSPLAAVSTVSVSEFDPFGSTVAPVSRYMNYVLEFCELYFYHTSVVLKLTYLRR